MTERGDTMRMEHLPPHSPEAEAVVLGGCLGWPGEVVPLVREKLGDHALAAFYDLKHQVVAEQILALDLAGKPVELTSVWVALKDAGESERVGGLAFLSELLGACAAPGMVGHYLDVLRDRLALRRVLRHCTETMQRVREHAGGDVDPLLAEYAAGAMDLTDLNGAGDTLRSLPELGKAFVKVVETAFQHRNAGMLTGLKTDFSYLDKKCCGLQRRQVYVIGGESSVGKTSFLLSLTANLCRQGIAVGYLSPESAGEELFFRLCCILSGANGHQLHSGMLSEHDRDRLQAAIPKLVKWPLGIDDATALSPDGLRLKGRRLIQQRGAKVIILDHLHEVTDDKLGERDKVLAFKWAMQAARHLARKFDVPVVVAAQLSREAQKEIRAGRAPQKTDLRESGYIEQMADFIGILHLDRQELGDDDPHGEVVPVKMEICKQRNGPTGPVNFTFERKRFKYLDRLEGAGDVQRFENKKKRESAQELDV